MLEAKCPEYRKISTIPWKSLRENTDMDVRVTSWPFEFPIQDPSEGTRSGLSYLNTDQLKRLHDALDNNEVIVEGKNL